MSKPMVQWKHARGAYCWGRLQLLIRQFGVVAKLAELNKKYGGKL